MTGRFRGGVREVIRPPVTGRFRGGVREVISPPVTGRFRARSSDQSGMTSLMNIHESSPTILGKKYSRDGPAASSSIVLSMVSSFI